MPASRASISPHIGDDEPASRGAHQVVHVPEGTPARLREAPASLRHRVEAEPLTASADWTAPQCPDDLDAERFDQARLLRQDT